MFRCEICNFSTTLKTNYTRHLNTKKHIKNSGKMKTIKDSTQELFQNDHKMTTNDHKMTTNDHKMTTNNSKKSSNNFFCTFCSKSFSTKPHLRRHQLHYCKQYNNENNLKEQLKIEKIEKKKLYKKIEELLVDNGKAIIHNVNNNTTINNIQQNNIVINNYGDEDLSHITDSVLEKLICTPGDMINNLTKMIHFNVNKPENMNMYIPSRKQKYIKVYRKNQWMLEKKHERIPDLVDRNYNILDTYYEDCGGSDKLNEQSNKFYKNYQKLIDQKNDKVIKQEYDSCELEILNNSDMVMNQHKVK